MSGREGVEEVLGSLDLRAHHMYSPDLNVAERLKKNISTPSRFGSMSASASMSNAVASNSGRGTNQAETRSAVANKSEFNQRASKIGIGSIRRRSLAKLAK